MMSQRIHLLLALIMVANLNCSARQLYIRLNQVGYKNTELKTAAVFTNESLQNTGFSIVDLYTNKIVYSGKLTAELRSMEKFKYFFSADFSALNKNGTYILEAAGNRSLPFKVGLNIYDSVADSLLKFFSIQRCGYTDPFLHAVCHPGDISRLISEEGNAVSEKVDVTGGWHDAADYIKFLNTTAFTTYTLLFAYEFDPNKFGFDNNGNAIPDILEEAKVGLDWLLRANYKNKNFITQVQDLRDHDQGLRMPESDLLTWDRVGYLGIGKNTAGIYVAVMAAASRIWREKIHYDEFADKCLNAAENIYSIIESVPDIDKSGTGQYQDNSYYAKYALGAVELYETTYRPELLKQAEIMGDKAGADYWWSWAEIGGYTHYKLAKHDMRFKDYLQKNLIQFNNHKNDDTFGRAVDYVWGSNNASLGAALQAILWKNLTGENTYDSLMIIQRDYILGRNPWGISFIYGIGTDYSRQLHSQVGYFNHGRITGALAGGPVKESAFKDSKIVLGNMNFRNEFQSSQAVYFDDRMDYLTNEPAICSNATALFVFGCNK